jgi:hypothetical protein
MPGNMLAFDPNRLTPVASLNRVRIVDLPGIPLDDATRGRTFYDLLSAPALGAYVRQRVDALGLPLHTTDPTQLLPLLDGCFEHDDEAVRAAAEDVARWYGRNLGLLLLTLRRGDAANRQARPEWTDAHWAHWAGIRQVWLGGGLVSGQLGTRVVRYATERLSETGMRDCTLHLSMAPSELALVGAARSVAGGAGGAATPALVFDFGHSRVKRALAIYRGESLGALRLLPALPALTWSGEMRDPAEQAHQMLAFMGGVLVDSWCEMCRTVERLRPQLIASVATYVVDGRPAEYDRGAYAQMRLLPERADEWLARHTSERVGIPVKVELLHDGSAAARTYAGAEQAAVIMLGSAIGTGFPPGAEGLRPLAAGFEVSIPV